MLKGIYTPGLATFLDDGGINEGELRRMINWLIEKGVSGLYPNGSTGEFIRLSFEERKRVIYRRGGNARQFCSAGSFSLAAAVGGCFSAACMAKCQPTRPHSPPPVHGLTLSGAAGVKAISCNSRL